MMSELVERLRALALKANFPSTIDDLKSAANEIETLRASISKIEVELRVAREALCWVYRHGVKPPHPGRPEWVSNAFHEAFDDEAQALTREERT